MFELGMTMHQGDEEFFLALPFHFYDWNFSILFQTSQFQRRPLIILHQLLFNKSYVIDIKLLTPHTYSG